MTISRSAMPQPLQPLDFPLHGSRLIEASAGTGKTFTIAMLYLRLVLGHGGEQAYARPLTPPEILVVTFTDAATQELRDRIRARLAEAAECFRADPDAVSARAPGEELLHDLRADYPPDAWPGCARQLQLAAEWMDEAAVSTIHGWCNRMLREHAFDSNSLFTQRLEADQRELLAEAVRDYWRSFLAPLDDGQAAEVREHWTGPAALQAGLKPLLEHAELLPEAPPPCESLRLAGEARAQRLAELKSPWGLWCDELQQLLDDAVAARQVDGRKLKASNYRDWLDKLRAWAADAGQVGHGLSDSALKRLTPEGLAEAWRDGAPPGHLALQALADLPAQLAALPGARDDLLAHAARWVAARLALEQERRAQMGFDDLLTRLDAALQGEGGPRLAETMRRQFPVALIDEFQDTDPVQYRIFDAVYRVAHNDPTGALVLIGDPKQAIYAFRGADIHTYLQARRACGERLYTLQKNFRSSAAMVAAANHLFEQAERAPAGPGAFLFRQAQDNPVPFLPAQAQGRQEVWQLEGQAQPALTLWQLSTDGISLSREAYLAQMAAACASEMVRLLQLAQEGQGGFGADGRLVPLRPADLAVLVNNGTEADAIRQALALRGVRSVYLSERESVYNSPQAAELQLWLQACAEPDDPRRLRAALATPTLALSWAELDALQRDELAWEERVLQFRAYRERWRRQGVLPMLRHLLHDFDVPARLLAPAALPADEAGGRSGERMLTDLLHLAELLQHASGLLDGEHALLRHLVEQREEARDGAQADALQLRLESDADLVQVITIHKSKGLEYPLVFLPFASNCRLTKADDLPLKWHDEQGRLRLALSADEAALRLADRERLGEDLRKLYVALTRARHATWIGVAPLADLPQSALGHLIGSGLGLEIGQLDQSLQALAASCEHIRLAPAPQPSPQRYQPEATVTAEAHARVSVPVLREPWWVASYSALQISSGVAMPDEAARPEPAATDSAREEVFRETPALEAAASLPPPSPAPAAPEALTLHGFVRGKEAGTFLHDLLEWAARQGFGGVAAEAQPLREQLERRCALRGWSEWIEPLGTALRQLLVTPLTLDSLGESRPLVLAQLPHCLPEMEFWLATHQVEAGAVDALVRRHTLGGAERPALLPARLNGMLKGFMDLVFEHGGRYYVADYKSNWLGPDGSAYTAEVLRAEVLHKRYELQYTLYLLALHRLLRARLSDYDYDRHLGGAVYLFLRGLDGPCQGLHLERPPRALIEALDRLFSGAREEST